MTGYLTRDRIAIVAALAAPLAVAAVLLPFRASWSNTNVALLLVVVIVGVAAIGNRTAGALQARLVAVTLADQAGRAFGASHTARSVS
jgi:uncharacterized membrane protein